MNFPQLLRQLFIYSKQHIKLFYFLIFGLICTGFSISMLGVTIKTFIDNSFLNEENLHHAVFNFTAFSILLGFATAIRIFSVNLFSEKLCATIKTQLYEKILHFPIKKFDKDGQSQWINFISSDLDASINAITSNSSIILRNIVMFCSAAIFLATNNWRLALIVLAVIPIILSIISFFGYKLRNKIVKMKAIKNNLFLLFNETISNVKTVKLFSGFNLELKKLNALYNQILEFAQPLFVLRGFFIGLMMSLMLISISVVLYFGGKDVVLGKITIGSLSSFIFYAIIAASSIGGIIECFSEIGKNHAIFLKIQEILNYEDGRIASIVIEPSHAIQSIIIRNLSFKYENSENYAFENINLTIKKGEKIAIIGQSGSGKTSLANLLLKLYDDYDGDILLSYDDGLKIELKNIIEIENYQKHFSALTQEIFLFSDTIYNNITYGSQNVDKNEIDFLLRKLNLYDFICGLPNGLETKIGDQSIQFSVGQKQRILIIRALLKQSQLLILDEPSSALDEDNEKKLYDLLLYDEKYKNRTIIFITHKLNFTSKMDQIIDLSKKSTQIIEAE